MQLRAPATPLITVDPYFSLWSFSDRLNESNVVHWTGKQNTVRGIFNTGTKKYRFMGLSGNAEAMRQTGIDIDALSTTYTFECDEATLKVSFLSPAMADDLFLASRPLGFCEISCLPSEKLSSDSFTVSLEVSEEICLNEKGQSPVMTEALQLENGIACIKMGNTVQAPLNRSGDDVRIDWGYFYLSVKDGKVSKLEDGGMTFVKAESGFTEKRALFTLSYDDIYGIEYFGTRLRSYWNKGGEDMCGIIPDAFSGYDEVKARAKRFSEALYYDAVKAGGEKYAELLLLAYRQVMAAHKIAVDENGEILFISKECFSNGCAATVDVSYPSIPMFLYYNTELIKGMLRPIFRYAKSDAWSFDFAPHDAGQYPLVNGQVYGAESEQTWQNCQMPVEECGNVLIMLAAVTLREKSSAFAEQHLDTLHKWAEYLLTFGSDPQNQLCTDDFAGHLAHNCNLSLKAIMGLEGMSKICKYAGHSEKSAFYAEKAKEMTDGWLKNAYDRSGSWRLAFDKPYSFSMKYNAVWDRLWGSGLFPESFYLAEFHSYKKRINPYGMPLDNRAAYTKSDWLCWSAMLGDTKEDFEEFIEPLWLAYNKTESRVPLSDWYDTVTAAKVGFQHRSVQGGLFIRLLAK